MTEEINSKIRSTFLTRQRNFFAGCLGVMIVTNLCLGLKLVTVSEKIIMVPGISRDISVDGGMVSSSYLEETALLFASALLDLTPNTVEAKRDIILRHTSKRSFESIKSLQDYFAAAVINHKKFELSSFVTPLKLHVDNKKLEVIFEGVLSSVFGKRGFEERNVKYKMGFDYIAGHLKLKEFVELVASKKS